MSRDAVIREMLEAYRKAYVAAPDDWPALGMAAAYDVARRAVLAILAEGRREAALRYSGARSQEADEATVEWLRGRLEGWVGAEEAVEKIATTPEAAPLAVPIKPYSDLSCPDPDCDWCSATTSNRAAAFPEAAPETGPTCDGSPGKPGTVACAVEKCSLREPHRVDCPGCPSCRSPKEGP